MPFRVDPQTGQRIPVTQQPAATGQLGGGQIPQISPELGALAPVLFGSATGGALQSLSEVQQKQLESQQPSADEKKLEAKRGTLSRNLDLLVKNLEEVDKRGPQTTGRVFLSNITGGAISPEISDYEALRKGMVGQVARVIAGESGVLTDNDIKRAENLLPKITDTREVANKKLENIRILLGEEKMQDKESAGKTSKTETSTGGGVSPFRDTPTSDRPLEQFLLNQLQRQSEKRSQLTPTVSGVTNILERLGLGQLTSAPAAVGEIDRALQTQLAQLAQSGGMNDLAIALSQTAQETNPFMSPERLQRTQDAPIRTGVGESVQTLAMGIPFGRGANVLTRAAAPGAATGLSVELGEQIQKGEIDTPQLLKSAATGALISGAFDVAGKSIQVLGKKITSKPQKFMTELFKPSTSELKKFERNTGLDFADEIVKRDLKDLAGKNGDEILAFYQQKTMGAENAVDDYLRSTGKTVDEKTANKILDLVDEQVASLQKKGRVVPPQTVSQIQRVREQLSNVQGIGFDELNQTVRDLQQMSGAAIGATGKGTPSSQVFDDLQRGINKIIKNEVPAVASLKQDIQLNRLARDSIDTRLKQLARSETGTIGSVLAQLGPATGVGASLATGNPLFALLGVAGPAARTVTRSPQAKVTGARVSQQLGQQVPQQIPEALKQILFQAGVRSSNN